MWLLAMILCPIFAFGVVSTLVRFVMRPFIVRMISTGVMSFQTGLVVLVFAGLIAGIAVAGGVYVLLYRRKKRKDEEQGGKPLY